MPPADDRFRLSFVEKGCALSSLDNLITCVLSDVITVERLRVLRRETERVVAIYGRERGGLTVVEPGAVSDVSAEVRAESAALMRDFPSVATCTVIEGGGFKAVAARAIVAGMALLSRTRNENRIFDTVAAAAEWLQPRVPAVGGKRPPTRDEIIAAAERTRRAIPRA